MKATFFPTSRRTTYSPLLHYTALRPPGEGDGRPVVEELHDLVPYPAVGQALQRAVVEVRVPVQPSLDCFRRDVGGAEEGLEVLVHHVVEEVVIFRGRGRGRRR